MLSPCPFIPPQERVFTHDDIHALGADRSRLFYDTALNYAQSLWLAGFPAKALLLINRALSCNLSDVRLNGDAKPYHAVAWILQCRPDGRFIGNPRRHFQHLATRMVEPHKELRTWRAWACWYLAKQLLSETEFMPDLKQVRKELLIKPRRADISQHLTRLSPADDREAWESALSWAITHPVLPAGKISVVPIGVADVGEISRLAHVIWPEVYPSIISVAQIDYMLGKSYSVKVLEEDITTRSVHYALIREGSENIGYVAWEALTTTDTAFLHKLYLLPQRHGQGIGAQALQWVEDAARERGLSRITLRVNRLNSRAIRAYVRAGFHFASEVCTEIGDGFVMDDYIMTKPLTSA
ncbi:MAG: GNAT family N-acetyltransferase [Verrucomicrobia bacterium]|nr:GNAT family N-acetyltransferase [Verrucomicrobiota bacterium]